MGQWATGDAENFCCFLFSICGKLAEAEGAYKSALVCSAISLRAPYAMSGTDIAYRGTYAMSGVETAYGPIGYALPTRYPVLT
eukprot:3514386-Rhodomonas_salina.1